MTVLESRKQVEWKVAYQSTNLKLTSAPVWQEEKETDDAIDRLEETQIFLDTWSKKNFCHFYEKKQCKHSNKGKNPCPKVHYGEKLRAWDLHHSRPL